MREIGRALVVVSAVALAGCTRAPERTVTTEAPAPTPPVAESPATTTTANATESPNPTPAPAPVPASAETPAPSATAAESPTATETKTPPPPPPPAPPAPAARTGAPDPRDDATLYRWEDANGDLHYTVASEVPRDRARTARPVTADVSAVGVEPVVVPSAEPKPSAAIAEPKPSAPAAAAPAPSQPAQRPDQKRSTRHVDDLNRIYKTNLDADEMDKRYEQQKKDMKCRTVDGVVICG